LTRPKLKLKSPAAAGPANMAIIAIELIMCRVIVDLLTQQTGPFRSANETLNTWKGLRF
jgi:hypothetical protein